jgi:hypothetical protein
MQQKTIDGRATIDSHREQRSEDKLGHLIEFGIRDNKEK